MYPAKIGIVLSDSALWQEVQASLAALPAQVVFELQGVPDPWSLLEKIEKFAPETLLLEPSTLPVALSDFVRDLRSTGVDCEVVVVRSRPSPDDILDALRAGAMEYLYPPLGDSLKDALARVSRRRDEHLAGAQAKSRRGKLIGVLSVKGGCGATTLACHTALEIAHHTQHGTLLADLDFHCGLVRFLMQSKSRYSLLDAANNLQRLDPSFWRGLVSNGYDGLEVIASTPLEVPQRSPADRELRRVLHFIRSQYDWTVADLGQGLDAVALSEIEELDTLILVVTQEVPALQLAKLMLRFIHESGVPADKIRLVVNRVARRNGISLEDVESVLGIPVFAAIPNDYGSLEQAYAHGRLLPEGHRVRNAIKELTQRLTGLTAPEPRKKFNLFGL